MSVDSHGRRPFVWMVISIKHANKTWTGRLAIRSWLYTIMISVIQMQDMLLTKCSASW